MAQNVRNKNNVGRRRSERPRAGTHRKKKKRIMILSCHASARQGMHVLFKNIAGNACQCKVCVWSWCGGPQYSTRFIADRDWIFVSANRISYVRIIQEKTWNECHIRIVLAIRWMKPVTRARYWLIHEVSSGWLRRYVTGESASQRVSESGDHAQECAHTWACSSLF